VSRAASSRSQASRAWLILVALKVRSIATPGWPVAADLVAGYGVSRNGG
jgi:hypothetical protein